MDWSYPLFELLLLLVVLINPAAIKKADSFRVYVLTYLIKVTFIIQSHTSRDGIRKILFFFNILVFSSKINADPP